MNIDPRDLKKLLNCGSYSEFLQCLMEMKTRRGRAYTYADLSRKLGFKSRSFAREMVLGIKKIPPSLVPEIALAFELNRDLKAFFTLLVTEDPKSKPALQKIKARLLLKLDSPQSELSYSMPEIPKVYAALGEKEVGASLAEIVSRTGFKNEVILKALDQLQKAKLTEKKGNRFLPVEDHVSFEALKESGFFREYFQHSMQMASESAKLYFQSGEKLFFASAFSVSKNKLPHLKEDLHRLLLSYVDENEIAKGDRVVSLVCTLF